MPTLRPGVLQALCAALAALGLLWPVAGTAGPDAPVQREGLMAWSDAEYLDALWEAMLDARPMTALAVLPEVRRPPGPRRLSERVDPDLVRHWVEFIEPKRALRWQLLGLAAAHPHALQYQPQVAPDRAHPAAEPRHGRIAAASPASAGQWRRLPLSPRPGAYSPTTRY